MNVIMLVQQTSEHEQHGAKKREWKWPPQINARLVVDSAADARLPPTGIPQQYLFRGSNPVEMNKIPKTSI
jgi:hypothetical protein